MTRRQLGKLAAGAALLQKSRVTAAEGDYTDALDGFEGKVNAVEFDPKVYETLGAGDSFQYETFDGEHSFHGVKGLPFLAEHL